MKINSGSDLVGCDCVEGLSLHCSYEAQKDLADIKAYIAEDLEKKTCSQSATGFSGGDKRDRTANGLCPLTVADLLNAIQALSQVKQLHTPRKEENFLFGVFLFGWNFLIQRTQKQDFYVYSRKN